METYQKSWLIIQSIWIQCDKTNHNKVLQCLTWSCEENPVILKVCVYERANFFFLNKININSLVSLWNSTVSRGCFPNFPEMKWNWDLVLSLVEFQEYFSRPFKLHGRSCYGISLFNVYLNSCNEHKFTFFIFWNSLPFFAVCFLLLSSCLNNLSLTHVLYYSLAF